MPIPAWPSAIAGDSDRRRLGLEAQLAVRPAAALDARAPAAASGRAPVRSCASVTAARAREQLVETALVDDRAAADDRDAVTELLDLGEDVAREQDRDPLAGQPLHELAHVAHAGRVEPGGRLVEQQQLRARAAATPRCRAAAACRASSRRRGPCARSRSSTTSSTSSMRAAATPPSRSASSRRLRRPDRYG